MELSIEELETIKNALDELPCMLWEEEVIYEKIEEFLNIKR